MRIVVISETSAGDKSKDIMSALEGFEHEVINAGMRERGVTPELSYVHTDLRGHWVVRCDIRNEMLTGLERLGMGRLFLPELVQAADGIRKAKSCSVLTEGSRFVVSRRNGLSYAS